MGGGTSQQIQIDLKAFVLQIQQTKNQIDLLVKNEQDQVKNLNEQIITNQTNVKNEKQMFDNLFMKKKELISLMNEQIKMLSSEKQKQYEKDIEELKKFDVQLNFEKKSTTPIGQVSDKQNLISQEAKGQFTNLMNEVEQLKINFRSSKTQKKQNIQEIERDSEQFDKIYLEIKCQELKMNDYLQRNQQLNYELQDSNQVLVEERNFNKTMTTQLTQFENQMKSKFQQIFEFIYKQQQEELKFTQNELTKQKNLSKNKQVELQKKIENINELEKKNEELRQQILKHEYENALKSDINETLIGQKKTDIQKLKDQIEFQEKEMKQQIESLNDLKNENINIIETLQNLRTQFEDKILKFELDQQKQEFNQSNQNNQIQNDIEQIKENLNNEIQISENTQIIDNFQQMLNKSLQILQIQNDRLTEIKIDLENKKKELEQTKQKNLQQQQTIEQQNSQISVLKQQLNQAQISISQKEQELKSCIEKLEWLQNQIKEREKQISQLKKEIEALQQSNNSKEPLKQQLDEQVQLHQNQLDQLKEQHEGKAQEVLNISKQQKNLKTKEQEIQNNIIEMEKSQDTKIKEETIIKLKSNVQQLTEENQSLAIAKSSSRCSIAKLPPIYNQPSKPEISKSKMQGIEIYYQSETPSVHELCKTKAYLNSKSIVFCEKGCPHYPLRLAVFDCLNSQVYQKPELYKLPKGHVELKDKYFDLVNSSLNKSSITGNDREDFQAKLRSSYNY